MSSNVSLSSTPGARSGFFAEITLVLLDIRDHRASGRLSIRNSEKFGLAHLYFREARLVHVVGDKQGEAVLQELLTWSKGSFRFDSTALIEYDDVTWQQAQHFERWVAFLEMRGLLQGVPKQRLEGLTSSLTSMLPGKPIALPPEIEYHERYRPAGEFADISEPGPERVNLPSGSITRQLMEQMLSPQQRNQMQKISRTAIQQVDALVQQTRQMTQELTRRVVKVMKTTETAANDTAGSIQRTTKLAAVSMEAVVQRRENGHENAGDGI